MPKVTRLDEIEIKLRVVDLGALRAQLKRLRAREIVPRTYELNTLYDTTRQGLRRLGRLIRIRIERPAPHGNKTSATSAQPAVLTYKGPARDHRSRALFKVKEEAEVSVTDSQELARILRGLGLRPSFRYEKFRTTFALPTIRGLKIELDETPVGIFLELEGPTASIDRAARLLGYARKDYSNLSYGALYLAECRRRRRKPRDMLFATKKSR